MQKMKSYLIVEEVLQNVNKHFYANECIVSITSNSEIITFTIQDNGQGFQSKKNTGLGLLSIKERADNIKATLKIQSDQKNGTTIILSIPLLNVSL
ncbi:sensor histidine kinase [Myroides odoratimimus]|uniref:sensor histidine kinase n=1 Tax=Myroides odoratimimus TaxID=76832 RepID=UPI0002E0AC17|nr:ATP-binding protein [Myroides odoratimimus]